MKIKKLNKTHRVFTDGNAEWVAMFQTGDAFMDAILQLNTAIGQGRPYTGYRFQDSGYPWLFRQIDAVNPNALEYHALYLTTEEQITLLTLTYKEND